jgi:hypothetical protein
MALEVRIQCLRVYLGHIVAGGYKYRNLDRQVGGVSNLGQKNMSPVGLGPENDCTGKA